MGSKENGRKETMIEKAAELLAELFVAQIDLEKGIIKQKKKYDNKPKK